MNNLFNYWYRNFGIKSLSCKINFEFWLIELAFKSKLLHRKGQKIAFLQNTENSIQNKFGAYFPKIMHLWRISFSKRWGQSNIQSSALILFLSFPLKFGYSVILCTHFFICFNSISVVLCSFSFLSTQLPICLFYVAFYSNYFLNSFYSSPLWFLPFSFKYLFFPLTFLSVLIFFQ